MLRVGRPKLLFTMLEEPNNTKTVTEAQTVELHQLHSYIYNRETSGLIEIFNDQKQHDWSVCVHTENFNYVLK